jgi:hypothetical protein
MTETTLQGAPAISRLLKRLGHHAPASRARTRARWSQDMPPSPHSTHGPKPAAAHGFTMDTLPSPETKRWVIRRKAAVVIAVKRGHLSLDEACVRYRLSLEEFASWQRLIDRHGLAGLRTTRLQDYRGPEAEPA